MEEWTATALHIPAAVLDSVEAEEVILRCQLVTVVEDFLRLSLAKLQAHALVLRLLSREEAVRREIMAFYAVWLQKAVAMTVHTSRLRPVLDKNTFRTRAFYFARWVTALHPRRRQRSAANITVETVFQTYARCAILGTLRLPPTKHADFSNKMNEQLKALPLLLPPRSSIEDIQDSQHDLRAALRSERTLVRSVIRSWQAPIILRRMLGQLEHKESAKRQILQRFEDAARRDTLLMRSCAPAAASQVL